jgi:LysM repeat protein
MRPRALLFISLGLNAAFVAALLLLRSHSAIVAADTPDVAPAAASNAVKTQVVVRKQYFTWRQVESPDYRAYIANLRDIGCPEQTIRDIIIADVDQLYAKKRAGELATADLDWWKSEPDASVAQATRARLDALEQERRALLASLLGPDWQTREPDSAPSSGYALNGPVLGALPPETKAAVEGILARADQRVQEYRNAQKAAGKEPELAALARLSEQTRNELAGVLNPAQLEEFLLRYSETARDLRRQLTGFPVTPDEFRRLFRARDPIDQQILLTYAVDNVASAQTRAALQKQREDALRTVLGPERYREYKIATDPAFRDALATAQKAGAPDDMVPSLYAINNAAAQELDRIRNDPTLTPEQKAGQIKAVQDQQKAASDQLLGVAPPPTAPPPPAPAPPPPTQTYYYEGGQTIDVIANAYGITPDALRAANPGVNFLQLPKGTPLKIPPPPSQ